MDAIEFIKKRQRLCQTYTRCSECPAGNSNDGCKFNTVSGYDATEQIRLLEDWFTMHPPKTRQSVFLEQWPNAPRDGDNILMINPCDLDLTMYGKDKCYIDNCLKCRHEYWSKVIE